MTEPSISVRMRMQDRMDKLTASERKLVAVVLQDYPVGGLGSITKLAKSAGVSTPTVIRMARKLGFDGFPDLQEALRSEISDQLKGPIAKKDAWLANAADEHTLNRFADAISSNVRNTLQRLDPVAFDAVAALLADTSGSVRGGLATDPSLAGCRARSDRQGAPRSTSDGVSRAVLSGAASDAAAKSAGMAQRRCAAADLRSSGALHR